MQYLKALVTGLGILIILCVGLLAYGLLSKTGLNEKSEPANMEQSIRSFGDIVLSDHPGCRISAVMMEGNQLILRLDGSETCQKVVVVDMVTGDINGSVRLAP